jgi:predicted hydrocarbon binding protein
MTEHRSPHETVIACISNSVSFMLGRGARAAMREAGKKASWEIWPDLPENTSFEEAAELMRNGVASLQGFGEFTLKQKCEDGSFEIEFKNCNFAQYVPESGQPCGEQAICFLGFGLVEETLRRLTGQKMEVKLIRRDETCGICHETALPR